MRNSNDFEDLFQQDGYLWGFKKGDVIPSPIKRLRTNKLWNKLRFTALAIAFLVLFAAGAITFKVLIPGSELTLTEKYNFETGKREQAYIGYNKPFLLSGKTILWCNSSLESFPSLGTVIQTNVSIDEIDNGVKTCK